MHPNHRIHVQTILSGWDDASRNTLSVYPCDTDTEFRHCLSNPHQYFLPLDHFHVVWLEEMTLKMLSAFIVTVYINGDTTAVILTNDEGEVNPFDSGIEISG